MHIHIYAHTDTHTHTHTHTHTLSQTCPYILSHILSPQERNLKCSFLSNPFPYPTHKLHIDICANTLIHTKDIEMHLKCFSSTPSNTHTHSHPLTHTHTHTYTHTHCVKTISIKPNRSTITSND